MILQRIREFVAARPVASFFGLAYGFSWLAWAPVALGADEPLRTISFVLGGFGPALAGAVATWLAGDSVRAWAGQIVHWRVAPRWYLVAFALPLVVVALASLGLAFGGHEVDIGLLSGRVVAVLSGFVFVALVGGGNEEPGWRGFALPRLQERYSPIQATLVLGVVWAFWHLPLLATGPSAISGTESLLAELPLIVARILNIVGVAFLLTWVYNGTGESVLVALLAHAGFNTANSTLVPLPFEALNGDAATAVLVAGTVAVWVVAILLVVLTRGRLGYDADGATHLSTGDVSTTAD
ncbi:CPBP family intramembrane metalloprotease [Haloferax sp. MBLA0076]|uniref:CPBP family intramembrane metalloprotease n=1 Tax=Haloferax litoreum TaxID=2666140 RepID=A0A6A8GFU5_9EURY|nr:MULTISPECIES: CPBP family intramembrane glutamic endopeptidase [Haloferax]KAB1193513.1 CPBP family intramembrane metalloprotease [Haloferax sp. CBA1148]MRX22028.1 CPBP family intramembrane metalloprotease [Haloferax litoreum]